ncbi:hypothetical protein DPMN_121798 [Dreissena polymorpha]|uniref:Uncharacterized protein n=1 Tax=Dreissena polymorpha TaxID=45954 RepID=A0A9D4JRD8_DREPO|nr:hypothetical protein DPMN_121798 [Dreissena polymorpha]
MYKEVPDRSGSPRIIIRDEQWSFRMLELRRSLKTITPMTTRHPHGPSWQKHTIHTSLTRTVPNCYDRGTGLHGRDTDKQGPTRHLHGPSRTYTTATRTNTAAIRTKHDLPLTDNNLYKRRFIFGDSIILQ